MTEKRWPLRLWRPGRRARRTLAELVLLLPLFAWMLYVRVALTRSRVFDGAHVRFQGNDPWYHMRLIENTVHNFPTRIMYDPMTHYPVGSVLHFGPLYDQVIAAIALLVGLGSPTHHTVEVVGAYFPAALGALCVVPAYLLARELGGRACGYAAALVLALLPGQFLARSTLGFTDHHVAEVFLFTLTLYLFVRALRRTIGVTLSDLRRDLHRTRGFTAALAAGIALGLFFLTWVGAPLLVFILVVFGALQSISDVLRGRNPEYLAVVGVIAFLTSSLLVLPYVDWELFSLARYSPAQPVILLGATGLYLSFAVLPRVVGREAYPLVLLGGIAGAVFLSSIVSPQVYHLLEGGVSTILPGSGSRSTIMEARPLLTNTGVDWGYVLASFEYTAHLALAATLLLLLLFLWDGELEALVVVVWNAIVFTAMLGQNRFSYYFAVNAAVSTGLLLAIGLDHLGWRQVAREWRRKTKYYNPLASRLVTPGHVTLVLLFLALAVYPLATNPSMAGVFGEHNVGQYHRTDDDWFEALEWMRENTPKPGVDYYGTYSRDYEYPKSAYGVMSWWDYGHWITYKAHRIPNSNPFQQGVMSEDGGGAAQYFMAQTEREANHHLELAGSRYVVTGYSMATGIFNAMATWASGSPTPYYVQAGDVMTYGPAYYRTMVVRLHLYDGRGFTTPHGERVPALRHYRLVYESASTMTKVDGEEVKRVKIFEYVPGARVEGDYESASTVVSTNQGREFNYTQRGAPFTLPYPGEYTLTKEDGSTTSIRVSEEDALRGRRVSNIAEGRQDAD